MNFAYLVRVFWARRLIIIAAVVSSLLGGVAMIMTATKAYEATSRVELDLVKRDPITGFSVKAKNAEVYINSQIASIRDYQVADRAVADLGWLDNPDLQQQYAALPLGSAPEFSHWVAQRIIGGTYVVPVEDSNILEIRFRGTSPEMARILSAAMRNAYVNNMADTQREMALASMPSLTTARDASAAKLAALEERKAAMERATGVILADNKGSDMESQSLNTLIRAKQQQPAVAAGPSRASTAELKLQQLNDAIDSASRSLGPNNPVLQSLHRQHDAVAAEIAAQRPADEAKLAVEAHQKMIANQVAQQTSKVLSHSRERIELKLLQDEINAEHDRYSKIDKQIVDAQRLAGGGSGNVIPIGPTDGPDKPVYPNNLLVLAGAPALGLVAGLLLALVTEMFDRRVRTERGLQRATGSAVIVLPRASRRRTRGTSRPPWFLKAPQFLRKRAA